MQLAHVNAKYLVTLGLCLGDAIPLLVFLILILILMLILPIDYSHNFPALHLGRRFTWRLGDLRRRLGDLMCIAIMTEQGIP